MKTAAQTVEKSRAHLFQKGQSGNPKGRPKDPFKSDHRAFRFYTEEAVERVIDFMRGTVRMNVPDAKGNAKMVDVPVPLALQLNAAQIVLERGWGKPKQALMLEDNTTPNSNEEDALEFLESRISGIAARLGMERSSEVVDLEPTQ